jgi:hypothetical protein
MHKVAPIKRLLEKATGLRVPTSEAALTHVRTVRPRQMKFKDDGYIPNNPTLSLLLYGKAVDFDRRYDPAALIEAIFKANFLGQGVVEWGLQFRPLPLSHS